MASLSKEKMLPVGFIGLGRNAKISEHASTYGCDKISIRDHVRTDDFCVVSGRVTIGSLHTDDARVLDCWKHAGVTCSRALQAGIRREGASHSNDYSGASMCNLLVPQKCKNETFRVTRIERRVIIGANSVVIPGADVAKGCAIRACSLALYPTEPWGSCLGPPGARVKSLAREILELESQVKEEAHDSI